MPYILDGTNIPEPGNMTESNDTQMGQNRTLSGAVNRDYFGSNKRVWVLTYRNKVKTDFDTINIIYQSYLSTGTAKNWEVTEANYAISATTVHVDLRERQFSVGGESYISDFDLVLTEA